MHKIVKCDNCGDDEQLSSRTIAQCMEDDLWISKLSCGELHKRVVKWMYLLHD